MANKSTTTGQQNRVAMPSSGGNGGMIMPSGTPGLPAKMPGLPELPEALPQVSQVMQVFGEKIVQDVMESVEGCAATVDWGWWCTIEVED